MMTPLAIAALLAASSPLPASPVRSQETPPAIPATSNLLSALPADTFLAARVPNPKALLAQRETSSWIGFMTDEQWDIFLPQMLIGVGEEEMASEAPTWRKNLLGALGDATEMVGFMSGPVEQEVKPTVGLIVRGGERCSELLQGFMGADARSATIPGDFQVMVSDAGRAELLYGKDGLLLLMSSASIETSMTAAAGCLEALSRGGDSTGPFGIAGVGKVRQPNSAIEFAMDLGPVWEMVAREVLPTDNGISEGKLFIGGGKSETNEEVLKEVMEAASSMEWLYMNYGIGVKEAASFDLYVPYDADSSIGTLLGFFGAADKTLFHQVPANAISATVANVDIHGMADWILGKVEEFSKEAHAQAQGAIGMGSAAVGVDLMEGLIGNMTGDFLGFSSVPDTESEAGMVMAMAGSGPTTLVTMVKDADPMLDLVEAVIGITGMDEAFFSDAVEIGEDAEIELWNADESLGLPVSIGVGHGRLMLSLDPAGSDGYISLLKGDAKARAITADESQEKAMMQTSGSIITWQPTESGADIMESLVGAFGLLIEDEMEAIDEDWDEEDDAEFDEMIGDMGSSFDAALEGCASLWREYFSGTVMSELHLDGGMIRIHGTAR